MVSCLGTVLTAAGFSPPSRKLRGRVQKPELSELLRSPGQSVQSSRYCTPQFRTVQRALLTWSRLPSRSSSSIRSANSVKEGRSPGSAAQQSSITWYSPPVASAGCSIL